jgi:hypothetical protein
MMISMLLTGLILFSSLPFTQAEDRRCFPETGQCIQGRFREFWEQHGGVAVFGYPITVAQEERVHGVVREVQWFERHRLELHLEHASPYDVQIGHLGTELMPSPTADRQAFAQETPQEGCQFFGETGWNVCGAILQAWKADGIELDGQAGFSDQEHLALYGLPISPVQEMTLSTGGSYQVQWFERARLEIHSDLSPSNRVQRGLLGVEALDIPTIPERNQAEQGATPYPTARIVWFPIVIPQAPGWIPTNTPNKPPKRKNIPHHPVDPPSVTLTPPSHTPAVVHAVTFVPVGVSPTATGLPQESTPTPFPLDSTPEQQTLPTPTIHPSP